MAMEVPSNVVPRPERREFHRRTCREVVEIEWGSSVLTGHVSDISPTGMFVEIVPPLWVGATFIARLLLKPPLRLDCTVRRVEPTRGVAVTFALPEKDANERLEKLLANLHSL